MVKAGLCSQRRACRYLGLHRSSHRHAPKAPSDWLRRLHAQIEVLSHRYPRLGYRKLVCLLRREGWQVGRKLVQRIRREHGLRVQRWTKRPRRRGKSTGTIPTKAQAVNHVWSWDFLSDRTDNGGKLRILSGLDEHTLVDCLRFAMNLPVSVCITGCDSLEILRQALEVATHFKPLDATQVQAIFAKRRPRLLTETTSRTRRLGTHAKHRVRSSAGSPCC